MSVQPWNVAPILVCNGVNRCGWQPHAFVRSDKATNGSARQIFECRACGSERVYGVVDLRASGKEADA